MYKFGSLMSVNNKKLFIIYVIVFVISALLEASIILVLPKLLEDLFLIYELGDSDWIKNLFNILILIASTYLIRVFALYIQNVGAFKIGINLSTEIYDQISEIDISEFKKIKYQDILAGLGKNTDIFVSHYIFPHLQIINSAVAILAIGASIFILNPFLTSISVIMLIIIYSVILVPLKKYSHQFGAINVQANLDLINHISKTHAALCDQYLKGTWDQSKKAFNNVSSNLRNSAAKNLFIASFPRYFIELCLILILVCAIYVQVAVLNIGFNPSELLILGFAAQKLLPLVNQLFLQLVHIKHSEPAIVSLLDLQSRLKGAKYKRKGINYSHLNDDDLSASIHVSLVNSMNEPSHFYDIPLSGKFTLITGPSGSGKSTLMLSILDLIRNNYDTTWYLPITKNAFRVSYIYQGDQREPDLKEISDRLISNGDDSRFNHIIDAFDIHGIFERHEVTFSSFSGGEKQRLLLLNELSQDVDVLFLDEATNALNSELEIKVYKEIKELWPKTSIILISHNENLSMVFDRVVEIQ